MLDIASSLPDIEDRWDVIAYRVGDRWRELQRQSGGSAGLVLGDHKENLCKAVNEAARDAGLDISNTSGDSMFSDCIPCAESVAW